MDLEVSLVFILQSLAPLGVTVAMERTYGVGLSRYDANCYGAFVIGPDRHTVEAVCYKNKAEAKRSVAARPTPCTGFSALDSRMRAYLGHGRDPRSPLARATGLRGYHQGRFTDGLYPVQA